MKEKILSSLLTVFALSALQAQTNTVSGVPRLVVGITIDQLRSDYLEAFVNLYGDKGFKHLWREGKVFTDVSYNFSEVIGWQARLYEALIGIGGKPWQP